MVLASKLSEVADSHSHWDTDEGYSYEQVEYSFEEEDGITYIVAEVNEGGRDCDGKIDYSSKLRAQVTLKKDFVWNRIESSQRDYEAEKAGY